MKVLITGATGFLGTNIQEHFKKPKEHGCLIDDDRAQYSAKLINSILDNHPKVDSFEWIEGQLGLLPSRSILNITLNGE